MNNNLSSKTNFLVFTGPSNVGKTLSIQNTCQFLLGRGFNAIPNEQSNQRENEGYGLPTNPANDFYVLLKDQRDQLVLFYSWGDNFNEIQWLHGYIQELQVRNLIPNLIVMANRDGSEWMYRPTRNLFQLTDQNCIELPMGRMVRGDRRQAAVNWYIPTVFRIVEEFVLPRFLDL
ncbi:hypothetical protein [Fluviicola taffensis]|uniref:hypothetical protein n=1 Tax=Fluviicola taffensis TaxID=191579 RepID=UPI003137E608